MRNLLNQRPASLADLAERVNSGNQAFGLGIREFLDTFYSKEFNKFETIQEKPILLGDYRDLYLAATAEQLARGYRIEIPDWSNNHGKSLLFPYFPGKTQAMKSFLLVESPTAFRRRLLFVSKNALDRPLKFKYQDRDRSFLLQHVENLQPIPVRI